jgi:hypothetical protein
MSRGDGRGRAGCIRKAMPSPGAFASLLACATPLCGDMTISCSSAASRRRSRLQPTRRPVGNLASRRGSTLPAFAVPREIPSLSLSVSLGGPSVHLPPAASPLRTRLFEPAHGARAASGHGSFLCAILDHHRDARAVLFDLPSVLADAAKAGFVIGHSAARCPSRKPIAGDVDERDIRIRSVERRQRGKALERLEARVLRELEVAGVGGHELDQIEPAASEEMIGM